MFLISSLPYNYYASIKFTINGFEINALGKLKWFTMWFC